MKKRFTTSFHFLFLIIAQVAYSQDILWEKSFGGRHAEYLTDVQPTADYGFILGGSSLSTKTGNKVAVGSGDLDFWIWKINENGEPKWVKSIGGAGTDMLKSIKTTRDGGFILGGTSNSSIGFQKKEESRGGNDYWVVKLDASGEEQWQRTFGGTGQDDLLCVVPTKDGGYLLAGSSDSDYIRDNILNDKKSNNRGNLDYWIIRIDCNGNELWQKTYGGEYVDILRSVETTVDGGFILGGYSNSGQSGEKSQVNYGRGGDYWVLKIDDKGEVLWQNTVGGNEDDQLHVVHQTLDGGYVLAGNSNSGTSNSKSVTNVNGSDFWVIRLTKDGNIDWQVTYDFGSVDVLTSLVENNDRTFLIGGYSIIGEEEGISDFIALKISEKGERLWSKTVGSEGEDVLKKVIETRDGGYLMAGTSDPTKIRRNKKNYTLSDLNPFDSGKQLQGLETAEKAIDDRIQNASKEVNSFLDEKTNGVMNGINDALGVQKNSGFNVGLNKPQIGVGVTKGSGIGGSSGSMLGGGADKQPILPQSRDKKMNYGSKDFWVVKLKDKEKKIKEKTKIEVIPNPVISYTNIIIGFDFTKGTARLYDLGGKELQQFSIFDRTVPLNLSGYPMGIYIVSITTDKGKGSVKVIKSE